MEVSCSTEIITQITFQAVACHELFPFALGKFLNIYIYVHANKQVFQLQGSDSCITALSQVHITVLSAAAEKTPGSTWV